MLVRSITKEDLTKVFGELLPEGESHNHLNNTFIALIPRRRKNTKELKDFQPISLISVYKPIYKVLTSRFKIMMKGIISNPQGAFMAERQIVDAILI